VRGNRRPFFSDQAQRDGHTGGAPISENLQHHGLRGKGGENQVYGKGGADTIDAQTVVDLEGAPEQIFGGD
jgi:hypothetical protein